MYILHRGTDSIHYKKHCMTHTIKPLSIKRNKQRNSNKGIVTKTIIYYYILYK